MTTREMVETAAKAVRDMHACLDGGPKWENTHDRDRWLYMRDAHVALAAAGVIPWS